MIFPNAESVFLYCYRSRRFLAISSISLVLALSIYALCLRWQGQQLEAASLHYVQALTDSDNSTKRLETFVQEYRSSPYTSHAHMYLAGRYFPQDTAKAVRQLETGISQCNNRVLRNIMILQLAQIRLAAQEPQRCLDTLTLFQKPPRWPWSHTSQSYPNIYYYIKSQALAALDHIDLDATLNHWQKNLQEKAYRGSEADIQQLQALQFDWLEKIRSDR